MWLCLQHCTGINNWWMHSSIHSLACHQLSPCHGQVEVWDLLQIAVFLVASFGTLLQVNA